MFSRNVLTTSFENSRLVIKSTADYLVPGLLLGGAIVAVLTALAAGAVVMFMTHRIAGPIYRFEKYIKEVGSGRLRSDLKIRKKDQFQNMAEALNKMTEDLKFGLTEVNEVSEKLDKLIGELSDSSNREILLREDIKRIVSELKRDKQNLSKALGYFEIKH